MFAFADKMFEMCENKGNGEINDVKTMNMNSEAVQKTWFSIEIKNFAEQIGQ